MKETNFHGIIPYLVSPVDHVTGEVKVDVLRDLSEDLIRKGVHGLSPLGSTGEVHYLSRKQKSLIVKTVVEVADGRVPVIPGVSAYTTSDAINQIREYEKMGVDGVVLILSTYFKLGREDIINFFTTVASEVTCDLVLYNNPQFSSVDLTPDIITELAQIPNINYFKDATGNTGRLLSIIKNAGDKIKVFSASAHIPLFVLQLGGVGWMAGPGCVFPQQSIELYNLAISGKWNEAMDVQRSLWGVNEIFQKFNLAACIKAALEYQGYPVGAPVPPLKALAENERQMVHQLIDDLGNKG